MSFQLLATRVDGRARILAAVRLLKSLDEKDPTDVTAQILRRDPDDTKTKRSQKTNKSDSARCFSSSRIFPFPPFIQLESQKARKERKKEKGDQRLVGGRCFPECRTHQRVCVTKSRGTGNTPTSQPTNTNTRKHKRPSSISIHTQLMITGALRVHAEKSINRAHSNRHISVRCCCCCR